MVLRAKNGSPVCACASDATSIAAAAASRSLKIVTGVIAWIVPLSVPFQLGIFAILAFVALYGGRRWLKANPITTTDPHLNQRGGRLVGEVLTLTMAIEDGRGRARVGDGEWPVRGPDAAEGTKVRVVSADGGVLVVEVA